MGRVKIALSAGIIVCALLFPTSAFASSGTSVNTSSTSANYSLNSGFLSSFNQTLSGFLGGISGITGQSSNGWYDQKDYGDFEKRSKDDNHDYTDFTKWYDQNKENCPVSSFDIWKQWFCY